MTDKDFVPCPRCWCMVWSERLEDHIRWHNELDDLINQGMYGLRDPMEE